MRPELIRDALRVAPFRGLRVFLSDGSSHEIPHRDFAVVTTHFLFIAFDVNAHGMPRRSVSIDPIHVTHIEPLSNPLAEPHPKPPPDQPPPGNGGS